MSTTLPVQTVAPAHRRLQSSPGHPRHTGVFRIVPVATKQVQIKPRGNSALATVRPAEGESAAPSQTNKKPYRNFLFITAGATDELADDPGRDGFITAMARFLMDDGFVYVLRPNQNAMEDDHCGVRYMPLRETLPSFAEMTAVILINASSWATRVAAAYPDAEIYTLGNAASMRTKKIPSLLAQSDMLCS